MTGAFAKPRPNLKSSLPNPKPKAYFLSSPSAANRPLLSLYFQKRQPLHVLRLTIAIPAPCSTALLFYFLLLAPLPACTEPPVVSQVQPSRRAPLLYCSTALLSALSLRPRPIPHLCTLTFGFTLSALRFHFFSRPPSSRPQSAPPSSRPSAASGGIHQKNIRPRPIPHFRTLAFTFALSA